MEISKFLRLLIILGAFAIVFVTAKPCILRPYRTGLVCVCNSTYCDTLEFPLPKEKGAILVVSTSEQGLRFHQTAGEFSSERIVVHDSALNFKSRSIQRLQRSAQNVIDSRSVITWFMDNYVSGYVTSDSVTSTKNVRINIDHSIKHQKIVGFGGALTGSVAHLLDTMGSSLKKQVMNSYFSKEKGLGYSMVRTSIGGCDFDLVPWAYNEVPKHDPNLTNFSRLDERDLLKVGLLKEIQNIAGDEKIKVMAAAWSPPRWMKTNDHWTGASALRSMYYSTWADYHMRFLELMSQQGIDIWAISTGNEPMNGAIFWMFVKFMSLGWSPKEQGRWVAEHLGPKLRKSQFKDVLLFAGDDQRYTFPWWFDEVSTLLLMLTNDTIDLNTNPFPDESQSS